MAVNCSHLPIFAAPRVPEDNLVHGGHQEKDILSLLPVDPFGMNLDIDTTFTAINEWLEDLVVSDYGRYRGNEGGVGNAHCPVFQGFNFWWDTAMDFQPILGQKRTYNTFNTMFSSDRGDGFVMEKAFDRFVDNGSFSYGCCTMGDVVGCGNACAHGSVNVLRCSSTNDRFSEYVTKEALWHFFREHGVNHGCETMKNDIFGCGYTSSSVHVDNNEGVDDEMDDGFFHPALSVALASSGVCNNTDDRFGEYVTRRHFFGKLGVHHGSEFINNDIFECGETSGSVHVDKNNEVYVVGDTFHLALGFAFAFLGVRDLLTVERVCKSLRVIVQNDPLLWRSIQIDHPMNARITDDVLLQLTDRAQGSLKCLSLVGCNRVTSDGLKRVLDSNPKLTKLSVPGCINIKIEGVINCLKAFQPKDGPMIKCLRVNGRSMTPEQFEELKLLLGIHDHVQPNHQKPRFFLRRNIDLSWEDDRPIDVEICPKCKLVKLVYDCTAESCQAKDLTAPHCRACFQCINRCFQCGKCTDKRVHEEDFFLDYVCEDCGSSYDNHAVSYGLDGHDTGSISDTHAVTDMLDRHDTGSSSDYHAVSNNGYDFGSRYDNHAVSDGLDG